MPNPVISCGDDKMGGNLYKMQVERRREGQQHTGGRGRFALFLPSGDQGHNGGFAPALKQHPITRGITDKILSVIREGGDHGVPIVVSVPNKPAGRAFIQIAEVLRKKLA
jgi:hypothetical protein